MGYFDQQPPPAWTGTNTPVLAGITPHESLPAPKRRINRDTKQQTDLREWYRTCGPVRVAVNTPAGTISQMTVRVQHHGPNGWQYVDDRRTAAIMANFRGREHSQKELIRSIAVALRIPGEAYLVLNNEGNQLHYALVQSASLKETRNRPGWSEYYTTRNAKPGERGHHLVQNRMVYWIHHPDPDFPDDAWSPITVAEDSILRFKKAYRHIGRSLDSKLAMSNILWAKATTGGSNWQKEVWDWAYSAVENDDGIESISPLLMSTTEKPEVIETGSQVYNEQLLIAQDAMSQMARDLDFPTSWMIDGPGQAKFDNEAETYEWYLDNTCADLAEEVEDVITRVHLRPFLAATVLGQGLEPQDFRVKLDDTSMRRATESNDRLFEAVRLGLLDESTSADVLGVPVSSLADLPSGVSWEEYVLTVRGVSPESRATIFDTTTSGDDVVDVDAVPVQVAADYGWDALI